MFVAWKDRQRRQLSTDESVIQRFESWKKDYESRKNERLSSEVDNQLSGACIGIGDNIQQSEGENQHDRDRNQNTSVSHQE